MSNRKTTEKLADVFREIIDNGSYAEYDISINVKERTNGEYVYSFAARKIKGSELDKAPTLYGDPKTMDASVSGNEIVPTIAKIIIPDSAENINPQDKKTAP